MEKFQPKTYQECLFTPCQRCDYHNPYIKIETCNVKKALKDKHYETLSLNTSTS